MSRGFPSMTALLALLAIAGYKNRDKIAEVLRGSGRNTSTSTNKSTGLDGLLGQLGLGGVTAASVLSGGLGELLDRFRESGQGEITDSWVKTGPNQPCTPDQLARAIGPDVLSYLSKQTDFTQDELLTRLCRELPGAIDKYTPEGRLPDDTGSARR